LTVHHLLSEVFPPSALSRSLADGPPILFSFFFTRRFWLSPFPQHRISYRRLFPVEAFDAFYRPREVFPPPLPFFQFTSQGPRLLSMFPCGCGPLDPRIENRTEKQFFRPFPVFFRKFWIPPCCDPPLDLLVPNLCSSLLQGRSLFVVATANRRNFRLSFGFSHLFALSISLCLVFSIPKHIHSLFFFP